MLHNKTILITAGPTHEPIDPVRFIGNRSSGKMGYALAHLLATMGANVQLVSGPTNLPSPENVQTVRVQSAQEMFEACQKVYPSVDIAILCAAVADYTPADYSPLKLKKNDNDLSIKLKKTVDIAQELGYLKKPNQINIGFALETDNEESNAKSKLERKNFDFIVLNSLRNEGTCFGSDHNKITIIERDASFFFDTKPKADVAQDIVAHIIKKLEK